MPRHHQTNLSRSEVSALEAVGRKTTRDKQKAQDVLDRLMAANCDIVDSSYTVIKPALMYAFEEHLCDFPLLIRRSHSSVPLVIPTKSSSLTKTTEVVNERQQGFKPKLRSLPSGVITAEHRPLAISRAVRQPHGEAQPVAADPSFFTRVWGALFGKALARRNGKHLDIANFCN
ncbi:hypothetical protein ASPBRDRAFT_34948 [Aspergillus brasiliensis CBS 101740]|uniref:Uncharacterized protein n=1 Tax=Aspergillus brasiliensis (strain CBS 101740 / IMI 381727 / IBT 21946) TaxID=767769 RepID=A0A1L9U4K9_ASPBC|nr:hypothetical protein ASPBRDRAFT_34948 [Aspergillus brasiliensis CBS 101740]